MASTVTEHDIFSKPSRLSLGELAKIRKEAEELFEKVLESSAESMRKMEKEPKQTGR